MSNSLIQPHSSPSSSQLSHHSRVSNGNQACAACKYQRRKCASDCLLAPYFPHDRQRDFLNAHKLFGVSNITKIIRDLTPEQKDHAMATIIFQSNMRAKDPVNGCLGLIRHLEYQIAYYKSELQAICQRIDYYKAQFYNQQQQQQQQQQNAVPLYQIAPLGSVPDPRIEIECEQNNTSAEDHINSYRQINDESVSYQNNIDNFQQYNQNLMRFHHNDEANQGNNQQNFIPYVSPGIANQNEQYSWIANQQEAMLASSPNSSTNHGRQGFVMKNGFGEESAMKSKFHMTGNGSGEYENKFNNCSNVDISYSDHNLQSDRFNEEVVALKEENDILENQEDESLHHIYGLDLRNPASLFTVTN